jgi:hypothetical protein
VPSSAHVEHRQGQWHSCANGTAFLKEDRSRQPSLAAIRMPRVGRSSDSRAVAKQAFSPTPCLDWSLERSVQRSWAMAHTECFANRAQSQRRGRPGFAPGSLFVGGHNIRPPTTNARSNASSLTRRASRVKRPARISKDAALQRVTTIASHPSCRVPAPCSTRR